MSRLRVVLVSIPMMVAVAASFAVDAARAAGTKSDSTAGADMPKDQEYSYIYDVFNHSLVRPITRAFDWPLRGRQLAGKSREAANVDARGEVRLPSTWWPPRIRYHSISVDRLREGPGMGGPPPGRWAGASAKGQGVTPGIQIKDSKGDRFLLKFDPPQYPELATG